MQPLPSEVLRLWRIVAAITGVAVAVLGVAVDVAVRRAVEPSFPVAVVPIVAGALIAALGWVWAGVRYRSWRFELTGEWIQARWGVLVQRCATIPRNRIQTMTSENGPLDRLMGLTSVTIHTAGAGAPNLDIPHLDDATVDWLRQELARGPVG